MFNLYEKKLLVYFYRLSTILFCHSKQWKTWSVYRFTYIFIFCQHWNIKMKMFIQIINQIEINCKQLAFRSAIPFSAHNMDQVRMDNYLCFWKLMWNEVKIFSVDFHFEAYKNRKNVHKFEYKTRKNTPIHDSLLIHRVNSQTKQNNFSPKKETKQLKTYSLRRICNSANGKSLEGKVHINMHEISIF